MTGGGGSQPQPPSPTTSAQVEASSQLAGQMFQAANAPTLGYEDAVTSALLNPYKTQLASALSAQSALSNATAQRAIQYQTDPQAYQAREMDLQAANARLGHLYGVNPTDYSFRAPSVFNLPDASQLPSLPYINSLSKQIGNSLTAIHIDKNGNATYVPSSAKVGNINFPPTSGTPGAPGAGFSAPAVNMTQGGGPNFTPLSSLPISSALGAQNGTWTPPNWGTVDQTNPSGPTNPWNSPSAVASLKGQGFVGLRTPDGDTLPLDQLATDPGIDPNSQLLWSREALQKFGRQTPFKLSEFFGLPQTQNQ